MKKPSRLTLANPLTLADFLSEVVDEINDINILISPIREKADKLKAETDAKEKAILEAEANKKSKAEAKAKTLADAAKLVADAEAEEKAKIKAEVKAKEKAEAVAAAKKLIKGN